LEENWRQRTTVGPCQATSERALRREPWGGVLVPRPRKRTPGSTRRDLEVVINRTQGPRLHTAWARLVGLGCLLCCWDDNGRALAVPYKVGGATRPIDEANERRPAASDFASFRLTP
jgi:hypothetical protein